MHGLHQSITDTRNFSKQISQPYVTQGNATERLATDSYHGRLSWGLVGDPGLGTNVGTGFCAVAFSDFERDQRATNASRNCGSGF